MVDMASAGAVGPSDWRKDSGTATPVGQPHRAGPCVLETAPRHTLPGALGFTSILVLRHISPCLY